MENFAPIATNKILAYFDARFAAENRAFGLDFYSQLKGVGYNPAYVEPPAVVAQSGGAEDISSFAGEVRVNGVNLPLQVIEQLRQAGISAISWLSAGELQDAVDACKFDGKLIDDPHGGSLRDKMSLTYAEQVSRRPRRKKNQTYEEMVREERESKCHEHEESALLAI